MQTVVIGSGAIQTTVWIPDVGVAACSNRSIIKGLVSLAQEFGFYPERNEKPQKGV